MSSFDDSIFTLQYADSVSPLSKAASSGDLEKIRKLIKKGSSPLTPDNRGWTAVHFCVSANQIEALKLIIKLNFKQKKHLVNLTTWEEVSPLLLAIKNPQPSLKMVKLLLKSGADPNKCTNTLLSPLHLACLKKESIDIVKLLVQYGANVNIQENLGFSTPLHFAVSTSQDLEVIRFLISLSDLSLKNLYERTAFLEACNCNFVEAVQLFLEKDKNLAKNDFNSGIPPIVYAAFRGNLKMVEILLESGADPNHTCKAMLPCKSDDSDSILFDVERFLPIHSSLTNLEVFRILLKLTDLNDLLKAEGNCYSFSLFVIVFADDIFFQTLLQSDLPDELKTFKSELLVKFILVYPDMEEIIFKKFQTFFKYNFTLEPDNVFEHFAASKSDSLLKNIRFLHALAQMGISSQIQVHKKSSVINILKNFLTQHENEEELNKFKLNHDLLLKTVLTLKQICRIVIRRQIRSSTGSDWMALKTIEDSALPDCLKKFILFEKLL